VEPFELAEFVKRNVNVSATKIYRHEAGVLVAVVMFATVSDDVVIARERYASHDIAIVQQTIVVFPAQQFDQPALQRSRSINISVRFTWDINLALSNVSAGVTQIALGHGGRHKQESQEPEERDLFDFHVKQHNG
jgi:hypothetical protein